MSITNTPIRDLAAAHPASITVFERFQIDLCAMGDKSLAEVCSTLSLSLDQVEEKITALLPEESGAGELSSLSLMQLIQRIVRVHHRRVRQDLPALLRLADRLAARHDTTASLRQNMQRLHTSLLCHIDAEEQLIFPLIARLAEAGATPIQEADHLKRNLLHMQLDHDTAVETLDELRNLTMGFTPPAMACAAHRALFHGLDDFDQDLRSHLYLEEDVLFPRALALHASLAERSEA